ncbi:hypothetical protein [Miniimonas sp. S16]|uniref:hypothetical protein n=1 Tax=Miniimonas sp. S16 TaxID=2171623 RepID=UPI000D525B02|nr:hypothetical protein [Miniimonas sp. S16]
MSATTYTTEQNLWTWKVRRTNHRFKCPLFLTWEIWNDPITDNYTPDEATAEELLAQWTKSLPDERTEALFGPGAVGISWFVTGKPFEAAPFQMRRYQADEEDFLTHYTWPEHPVTGERLNFNRLPVEDKLWRDGRANKGGFFQEATGWRPAALQPVVWVGAVLDAAALDGPQWQPRYWGPVRGSSYGQ